MTTKEAIIAYISQKGQVSGADIAEYLGISRQGLFRHLHNLVSEGRIVKIGRPPKVFYCIKEMKKEVGVAEVGEYLGSIIEERFLIISPAGVKLEGLAGFKYWCEKNNLPLEKTASEYVKTLTKYDVYVQNGLIDGTEKMKKTFDKIYFDKAFYVDFYSIERFGKTKLGQLLLYAKQSQDLVLMKEILSLVKPKVDDLIKKFKIDAIGFIPPTVKRERQLMKVLERGLGEKIRKISIIKIKTPVTIPQKTLAKLEDRIDNAKNTFVVDEDAEFNNILLIDDAVGSGATLNEVAKKIKSKSICKGEIITLALTGSYKGFDVISEV